MGNPGTDCLLVLLIFIVLLNVAAAAASIDLYVSQSSTYVGTADGSLAKPFKTLAQVQLEARVKSKLAGNSKTPINVFLRAGRYELSSTFDFTDEDSGASSDAPVTYQAYCDATVEKAATSVRKFPYQSGLAIPPRLLWNGVDNVGVWAGPADPFAQMGVNISANSLSVTPAPAISMGTDIGSVCVDKNNGAGHTCYADGSPVATCISGCMVACQNHIARKRYSDIFYAEFTHLFGKDLSKEEDCVETCSLSCRGCEKVVISGSKLIEAGTLTWTLDQSITVTAENGSTQVLEIFRADLSSILPALAADTVPAKAEDFATFNTLVVKSQVIYNRTTFSSRVSTWTNVKDIMLDLRPQRAEPSSLHYSPASVNSVTGTMQLDAGGSELSYGIFAEGPGASWSSSSASLDPGIRVENVLQELDSPGEWFFDVSTRWLYLIPLSSSTTETSLASSVLEIPLLHQLVRVSGSRENQYVTPTHAQTTLKETTSDIKASNLRFRYLTFSGTQLHHLNVYERIPGSEWPMTRVASIFLDNGIAVLARRGFQLNSFHEPVLAHLLVSRAVNISFNQVHHFGQQVAHSVAIMVAGAKQTTIHGNLVFGAPNRTITNKSVTKPPLFTAAAYHVVNANGANYDDSLPLIRSIVSLGENAIPVTSAQTLSSQYQVTVPLLGFDINTVAKLVGAPECFSGSGRVGSLYGEHTPFTYTSCSGCCSVHNNYARLRVSGSGVAWTDATSREVVVRPGETVDLAATASDYLNSIADVYLGFHVVTPNQIINLPTRAKWQILTRRCQYADHTYQETCGGPCIQQDGCGNSNAALQQALGTSLACASGYESDPQSLVCTGPFEAQQDCDGSGVAKSHLYYNCGIDCFTTSCT
ncbi:uncharacterized protein KRP23_2900 [Phytophthora ramorum]|uniref:uncharacterized protein n=1 Tax=Phytophthora ramorum TaxID=164328 RepID=UPI003095983D|nr:hypothetical protein KRP23_2900 [Phytophthora ramorum]